MGVEERKERERQQRELGILHAAERLFVARGYDLTTMDEIALAAEFTKRTVYSYFSSKEELRAAVFLRHLRTLVDWFGSALSQPGSGLEKVRRIGDAWVRFAREETSGFQLMAVYHPKSKNSPALADTPASQEAERLNLMVFDLLTQAFCEGKADGSVRPDIEPKTAALFAISASSGVLQAAAGAAHSDASADEMDMQGFIACSMDLIADSFKPHVKGETS